MYFQRNWRHFTDISFPRGKQRPHLCCQQFLVAYAMLSHYLICGEFYINHKEKTESIMLLRMDIALLIFLALYQHWWIKPPMVPVKLKQGHTLLRGKGNRDRRSSQLPLALWGGRVRASTEVRTQHVEQALHPAHSSHFPHCLRRTVALKLGRHIVWDSSQNVFSSQISIKSTYIDFL